MIVDLKTGQPALEQVITEGRAGKRDRIKRYMTPGEKLSAKQVMWRAQSEDEMQSKIISLATKQFKWRCYHPWNSMHSTGGWPDLFLVKGKRIVIAELKREDSEPRADQIGWLLAFANIADFIVELCGRSIIEVYIWRPSDEREWEAVLSRAA